MVDAADSALRAKAMISSPSKLFEGRGEQSGEGYEDGWYNKIPDVVRAVHRMIDAASRAASFGMTPTLGVDGGFGMLAAASTSSAVSYGDDNRRIEFKISGVSDPQKVVDLVIDELDNGWTSTPRIGKKG
jgi:hypothetical protein